MQRLALFPALGTDERDQLTVATVVTLDFDLRQQRIDTAPLLFGAQQVGFKRLLQRCVKSTELIELVHRLLGLRNPDPLANRVRANPVRLVISCSNSLSLNFPHHFHTDHPVFSCSKNEQKQLNTWISFRPRQHP